MNDEALQRLLDELDKVHSTQTNIHYLAQRYRQLLHMNNLYIQGHANKLLWEIGTHSISLAEIVGEEKVADLILSALRLIRNDLHTQIVCLENQSKNLFAFSKELDHDPHHR